MTDQPPSDPPVALQPVVRNPTLRDVPMWLILQGVGHVLIWNNSLWHMTACGTWTPNGEETKKQPRRICAKCRRELPKLRMPNTDMSGPSDGSASAKGSESRKI